MRYFPTFKVQANTAMHLSRRRKVVFSSEYTLRPGDGERSASRPSCSPNTTLALASRRTASASEHRQEGRQTRKPECSTIIVFNLGESYE
jgi:hypothetical protein